MTDFDAKIFVTLDADIPLFVRVMAFDETEARRELMRAYPGCVIVLIGSAGEPMRNKPEPLLWLSDARGVFIPRDFANSFAARATAVSGVSNKDWAVLEAGPDHESYWDVWTDVCDNARVTDENRVVYTVYQNGDCWLIPVGMEWDEANEFFKWPEEESADND